MPRQCETLRELSIRNILRRENSLDYFCISPVRIIQINRKRTQPNHAIFDQLIQNRRPSSRIYRSTSSATQSFPYSRHAINTIIFNILPQNQTLLPPRLMRCQLQYPPIPPNDQFLRHGHSALIESGQVERIFAGRQFLPHCGDVFVLKHGGRGDRDGLFEERAVEDAHCAIHGWAKHGGVFGGGLFGGGVSC